MVIGQETNYGLTMINKTKTDGYLYGLAWQVIRTMKQKNKPKDMSTEIKMEAELHTGQF